MRYKLASHAAADKLCFEAAADRLLATIEQLLPGAVHGTRPPHRERPSTATGGLNQ
jgi:hypothetical protein